MICDSIQKNLDTAYVQRKSAVAVEIVREGRDVNTTVDHIQDHARYLRDAHIVIHTGTNNVVICPYGGENTTIWRLELLEANLQHHKYKSVTVSSIVHHISSKKVRDKIVAIKEHVQMMCVRSKWLYTDNDNIDDSGLTSDNVHSNCYGYDVLKITRVKVFRNLHILQNRIP